MGLINYLGNSKVIKRICQLLKVTDVQDGEGHSLVDENGIAHVTGGGGGSSTLAGLSDVDVTGAQSGDVLYFNGANWVDETLARVATSGSYSDLSNAPTALSAFNNDSGFITSSVNNLTNYYLKSETYTKSEVNTLIGQITTISILVVQTLPQTGESNIIYLVPKSTAGSSNVYDEYIYVSGAWELIGDTTVDLSNYYTKSEVDALIPDDLADLSDDSTHRLVTDTEKTAWSGKSVVSANPATTTQTLSGLEIDGVGYAVQSGGNVQSDWNETDSTADDYIKNKPSLATVATSGSYNDLSNKPTIPTVPTNVSAFNNDSGYLNNSTLPNSIQNLTIVSFSGAGSSDAYCLLCEIKINQTYINGPTEIILSERGRSITTRICISWQSVNNVDPGLAAFNVILGAHNDIWMVKTATSTWNLYIRKNENWSSIFVKNVYTYGGCTITWKMQNASLPSGGTQASFYLHSLYNYSGVNAGTNVTVQVVSSGSQYAYTVNAVDEKVGQTNTGATNSDFRLLYSATADDTNRIEGTRKGRLYWNPNSVRLFFMNGHGLWNNVAKTLTFQNGSDSNHAICHGAYGGDDNRWGLWPNKDGWESLGDSARRWGQIYSTNASISTSDRNEKKDIESLDEKAKDLILNLNPVSYKFIDGNTGRTHYGLIAQDVEKTLEKMNLSPMDFAGFCKDQKMDEKYKIVQEKRKDEETGEEYTENVTVHDFKAIKGEYRYGLRYEEFIAPLIKTVQIQQEEIEMLKKRLEALEGEK